jgi:hypothetical protein
MDKDLINTDMGQIAKFAIVTSLLTASCQNIEGKPCSVCEENPNMTMMDIADISSSCRGKIVITHANPFNDRLPLWKCQIEK